MFYAEAVTALHEGMKRVFDDDYPVEDFRNLPISTDYPSKKVQYPGIWVGFSPRGSLAIAGIGHREVTQDEDAGTWGQVTRWRFEGEAQFTIVTLSALARARLADEVIRVLAFGQLEVGRGAFRSFIQDNPLIAMQLDHDQITPSGDAETPGTPWGTDDIVYEITLSVAAIGEFTSTAQGQLVPLEEITLIPYRDDEEDPTTTEGWIGG